MLVNQCSCFCISKQNFRGNCLNSAKYLHAVFAVFWSGEPERVSRKGRAFVAARGDSDGESLVSGQTLNTE